MRFEPAPPPQQCYDYDSPDSGALSSEANGTDAGISSPHHVESESGAGAPTAWIAPASPSGAPTATLAAVLPPVARAETGTPPAGPQWREEVSSRIERFRRRRRAQATLPLDFEQSEALTVEPGPLSPLPAEAKPKEGPAARQRKVIPFEEIRRKAAAAADQPVTQLLPVDRPANTPAPPLAHGNPSEAITGDGSRPWGDRVWPPAPAVAERTPPTAEDGHRRATAHHPGINHAMPPAVQASLEFPGALPPHAAPLLEETVDFPVAPIAARVMSAVYDAALLASGYALFFGIYTGLGGRFAVQRAGIAALAAALALLAGAYLFLFLFYAAATPGMRWLGLRLVDFEGLPARRGQRLLRVLAIVPSSAALGFGFLWAVFDEEALAWHDRISRTCLTMSGSRFLKAKLNRGVK